jgi:hypothetical protein
MNLQSLVVVVLRLMAFDFFLRAAVQVAPQLLRFANISQDGLDSDSSSICALAWGLIVLFLISATLIWICALPIARVVTRGISNDVSFGTLSLRDCYSIAFIGVGVFYIARQLPHVLNWIYYFMKTPASARNNPEHGYSGYLVLEAFIPFIAGVLLFLNGRRWAGTLTRQQKEES